MAPAMADEDDYTLIVRNKKFEVHVLDPWLVHDFPQKILDHAPMGEEQAVAEVVLSHDFSAGTLSQSLSSSTMSGWSPRAVG